MKLLTQAARLQLALVLLAAPMAAFSADEKKMEEPALMEPVKGVLDHYLLIQRELAKDSMKGVDENATAISKAVGGDEMKMLPADVAKQADALARAKDIKAAREALSP